MRKLGILSLSAATALLCAVPVSMQWSQDKLSVSLDRASAGVGEPLTPGSVAGVHRRVERRAARRAYNGAAAGTTGVAAATTPYDNGNSGSWNRPGYGYGAAAVGLAAGAAVTGAAYYAASGGIAGATYGGWNGGANAGYYPTRAIYSHGYVPASYYGPVCNPRFDSLCQ